MVDCLSRKTQSFNRYTGLIIFMSEITDLFKNNPNEKHHPKVSLIANVSFVFLMRHLNVSTTTRVLNLNICRMSSYNGHLNITARIILILLQ